MKVSTENDNNFGYEKITILVDNIPLSVMELCHFEKNKMSKILVSFATNHYILFFSRRLQM
jgi:hypothetical protein